MESTLKWQDKFETGGGKTGPAGDDESNLTDVVVGEHVVIC